MRGAPLVLAILAVGGIVVSGLVATRRNASAEGLRADLAADLERGALGDLGRAQAVGRRLVLADAGDREAAAALAFANAVLAVDYGLGTTQEAAEALAHAGAGHAGPSAGMAAAAEAMLALRRGDLDGAARAAAAASAAAPDLPQPLYALGRARALAGDLPGAAHAFEAAIVKAPGFAAARVAWAEVRLDRGDAASARTTLETILNASPRDARAGLLLDEAEAAIDAPATGTLRVVCAPDRWLPPAVTAGCALARSSRARRAGARDEAKTEIDRAASLVPDEPRLLARTALALAQLGAVDRAADLLARARRLAAPGVPVLAWAEAAVTLGRGRARALPSGARPADPETRLLVARAALASGGLGALDAALEGIGRRSRSGDADLASFARLGTKAPPAAPAGTTDPVSAYVEGLRAQLAGNTGHAADEFRQAMGGHGDACRAAGEYLGALRALKLAPAPGTLAELLSENRGCVNLPRR
jgi:tetratricopeptide (TPR) repeat protein